MSVSFYVGDVLIQNGSAISIAGLPVATTLVAGIVQLNDTTSSTSTTEAATANAVKSAYDLANAAVAKSTLTATGSIIYASAAGTPANLGIGSTGQVLTVAAGIPAWTTASGGSLTGITSAVTTALGNNALDSITDPAVLNTAVGISAGTAITTGDQNTLVGYQAGQALTVNGSNALMGHQAGVALTGEGNVGIGSAAGPTGAASNSVFVGPNAGNLASGNSNVGIGSGAVGKATGNFNTGVGTSAGDGLTTGTSNTFLGSGAGRSIDTGSSNTIIGRYTGGADPALSNNLILAAGTTIKLQVNENGAVGFGSTPDYGNPLYLLVSTGTDNPPVWIDALIWAKLTPLTTTSTASTTLLSLSAADYRGGVINLCVSDATSGKFHTDTLQFVNDSGFTSLQVIGGAHVGPAPYTASVAEVGGNIVVSVTSASTNSTKYVGAFQPFVI